MVLEISTVAAAVVVVVSVTIAADVGRLIESLPSLWQLHWLTDKCGIELKIIGLTHQGMHTMHGPELLSHFVLTAH